MDYSGFTQQDFIEIIEEKDRHIQFIAFELEQLKRAIFGSKSERFIPAVSPDQLQMFATDQPSPVEMEIKQREELVKVKQKHKTKPVRQKLPGHLRREEQIIEPPVDVSSMRCIGQEVTERLEMTPAQCYVRKIVRPKYVDSQGQIHIATLPGEAFPKCIAGTSVAAQVAVQKYVDHLPLYRQSKIYARQQIDLSRSTLNAIIKRGATLIKPVYEALHQKIMSSDYLMADESSLRVLTKDHPEGSIKGCMLVKVAPQEKLAFLQYIKTKEKRNIYQSLKDFQGHLQVDGNISYESLGTHPDIELMHCLVHSRRYFEKALDYDRQRASVALRLIQQLYEVERDAQQANLDQQAIQILREEKSIPLLQKLRAWLQQQLDFDEPKNPLNTAVRYMLKRWEGLTKYTTDGKLRPDNNLIENQIRPLALGRKNYLFAASHNGAKYAAIFYSLFATCQLNGIQPFKWLTHVYQRIPDHPINKIEELLPTKNYSFL